MMLSMRKVLAVALLALTACSAKSVEVSTAPTSDPTRSAPTTVSIMSRVVQCQEILRTQSEVIQSKVNDAGVLFAEGKPGLAEAREAAPVMALQAAAQCQQLLPECTTPAADWVAGMKAWSEEQSNRILRLSYGYLPTGPNPVPPATVRPDCR